MYVHTYVNMIATCIEDNVKQLQKRTFMYVVIGMGKIIQHELYCYIAILTLNITDMFQDSF